MHPFLVLTLQLFNDSNAFLADFPHRYLFNRNLLAFDYDSNDFKEVFGHFAALRLQEIGEII